MMNSKIIWILGLCLLAAACKKREYPPDKVQLEEEDMYFDGYVDNEPLSLKIGTDGYYCYSSYTQRSDSVYVFEGELRKFDCTSCTKVLKLELSDYKQRPQGAAVPVDSVFRAGNRGFIPSLAKANTLRFESHANKAVTSVRWNFSNGFSSQAPAFNYEFGQRGVQTISLTVRTTGNCESMVVNKIFVGGEGDIFACNVTATALQNKASDFRANIVGGKAPYRYSWSFGDGFSSSLAAPTHTYQWIGGYPVHLRIEDAEGHMCESSFINIAGNDQSSCAANISLSHIGLRNAFLNGAKIQWTDPSGIVLRSDSIAQPAASYFEVVNSQAYEPNEKGEKGRLLTVRFNVLLSSGNRSIWFRSEKTAIAVAYK